MTVVTNFNTLPQFTESFKKAHTDCSVKLPDMQARLTLWQKLIPDQSTQDSFDPCIAAYIQDRETRAAAKALVETSNKVTQYFQSVLSFLKQIASSTKEEPLKSMPWTQLFPVVHVEFSKLEIPAQYKATLEPFHQQVGNVAKHFLLHTFKESMQQAFPDTNHKASSKAPKKYPTIEEAITVVDTQLQICIQEQEAMTKLNDEITTTVSQLSAALEPIAAHVEPLPKGILSTYVFPIAVANVVHKVSQQSTTPHIKAAVEKRLTKT